MATTYTPNYNLAQPEVGGEIDTWGGLLNTDLLTIDTTMKAISDVANGAVPKAGGTMTGQLTLHPASGNATIALEGSSGFNRQIFGSTGTSPRWALLLGNNNAESTGNVGSDFNVLRYSDAGAFIDSPFYMQRSTGNAVFAKDVQVQNLTSTQNITSAGTVTALQDFKASSGNVVVSPTGTTGAVYIRPRGGSGTGETQFGQNITITNVPFASTPVVAPQPATPATFGLQAGGNFGGGIYLNDPGGGASWGTWLSSGNYNVGSGAVNGGGLTARMSINTSGVVSAADFTATSDRRLKTDVEPIHEAMDKLRDIVGVLYVKDGRHEAGVIAQDVQRAFPVAVHERDDGYLSVSHGQLQGLVIAALNELDQRVAALELL